MLTQRAKTWIKHGKNVAHPPGGLTSCRALVALPGRCWMPRAICWPGPDAVGDELAIGELSLVKQHVNNLRLGPETKPELSGSL